MSHSFDGEDRELAGYVESLLSSHNIGIVTGRDLAGDRLTAAIRKLIDHHAHGLIALKTRRKRVGDRGENRWRTSPWIDYEYKYARDQGKQAIAMVEDGVETGEAFENYENYERIDFDRSDPLEALLKLSRTLGIWKENFGILRVVQVRPDKLGREFRPNCDLKCRYRFLREGVWGQWDEADPIPQPGGGIHLYVWGVQDDEAFIQVEILKNQSPHWRSPATPQYVSVKMQLLEEGP